jgi:hypothetical protein
MRLYDIMNRLECASKARTRDIAGAADALRGRSHHPALNPKSRVQCATIASFTAPHLPTPPNMYEYRGQIPKLRTSNFFNPAFHLRY